MKRKIAINSVFALAAQIVTIICGFILPRIILDRFGSEVNGLTQSIKNFLGLISFLDLGIGQVVRSSLYGPLASRDRRSLSCVMISGRRFYRRLALILAGYAAVLMCIYPFLAKQGFGWLYTATLIAAMVISTFAQYYFGFINEQLLHADQKSYIIYGLQIIGTILNVVICVLLIQKGSSIHWVKLAGSIVFLIKPIVIDWYTRRYYQIDYEAEYTGEPIAQKWNGIAQHISAVVLDGTDTVVLTLLSTLTNVSVYSVYYMVISSIQGFYQSATSGIQSAVGALWAAQNEHEMKRAFSIVEMILHSVVVFLFSCSGLLIVPFVRVYTNGLTDAEYIQPMFAMILVVAYGIRCLRTPYNVWILAAGHFRQTQICHIMAAVLNLCISVFAVLRWGLVGVALGTLLAMIYQTIWMAMYNSTSLLKRSRRAIIMRFAEDGLIAWMIWLLGSQIGMRSVSYLGWFEMAVKVAAVALGVILFETFLLHYRQISSLLKSEI